jgi:uncharacterized protein YqeY
MTLKEQLMNDVKTAMKAGAHDELTTLRGLTSVLKNAEIAKQMKVGASAVLTDEEAVLALLTEAKKRKDAINQFTTGGRAELAENEQKELLLIQRYLPKQLSAEETAEAVDRIMATTGLKEFGPLMKAVMTELRGKADGQLITDIIKKKLG